MTNRKAELLVLQAVLTLALLGVTAPPVAEAAKSRAALRQENRALRKDLGRAGRALTAMTQDRDFYRRETEDLAGDVERLRTENFALATDNANLRAGLPDAIKAVPIADFPALVFSPARSAWPCDSFYSSGSYWSFTFDSPSVC